MADTAADLSAGTIYAAKATQNDDESFDIAWIEIASSNDTDVKACVDAYTGTTNFISDADVDAWAADPASENCTPFLETRKAAKAKGATAEWRKMEGVLANPEGTFLYMAMADIGKGMSDEEGDIQLEANPCGIV